MDVVVLIGRILFVAIFASSAIGHFTNTDAMAGYSQAKGLPYPRLSVLVSGAAQALASIMIVLGIWPDLAALVLFVFLIPTAFLFHAFWKESDPMAKQNESIAFMKDISLAGAALLLFAFFAHTTDLGLTVTGPLFSLG